MKQRKFKNDEEVDVYETEDIINLLNENKLDKEIISDAVEELLTFASSRIAKGDSVSIPYTVVIQRSILAEVVSNNTAELHSLKKTVGKEEYKEKFREIYHKDSVDIQNKRLNKKLYDYVKRNNKSLYNRYYLNFGHTYAETYVKCLSLCHIIPFNEEVEEMYQLLNNYEKD